jgi:acetoacetyl-CoA reductase
VISGKYAFVTGASRGIGAAVALELARLGAHVMIGYDTREDLAKLVKAEAEALYGPGCAEIAQLSLDPKAIISPFDCDILVNNAGISNGRSVGRTSIDAWEATLDVNLTGAFRMTQAGLGHMIEQGWGRIVNVTSVVGIDGRLGPSSYAASKAGLIGFTKSAALELANKGITVNAVAPGFIAATGLIERVSPENLERVLESIPMGHFGAPRDVALAVGYLVQAEYVTGTVLNVSGGYLT